MHPLLIAGIVIFVLFMLGLVISLCVIMGKDDDELEQKYGIRRS
jgi:hypothetical protein